jgi:hypothetical protein
MLGSDAPVLADQDAVGIMDLDRLPDKLAATEYLLSSKRTKRVFETDAGAAWNPSNRPE